MRLIDADALLNSGFPTIYHTEFGDEVINTDDIRNAQTVVPEDFMNSYEEGYERARKDFEQPQDKFTDLERKVIADSINYLLGAELLEENGYTEEVVNSLKSVLQKIGSEENHL